MNTGAGEFRLVATSTYGQAVSTVSGDWNRDGKLDIAYVTGDNSLTIQLGKGDGTFGAPKVSSTDAGPTTVAPGDFTGDGILDLLVLCYDRIGDIATLALYPGKGDGTFQAGLPLAMPAKLGGYTLLLGDLNNDGLLDLVVESYDLSSPNPASAAVLLGQGDGTFKQSVKLVGVNALLIADVNGDGCPDLLGQSSFVPGNGDGTFGTPIAAPWTTVLAAADFNRDGKIDIVSGDPSAVS